MMIRFVDVVCTYKEKNLLDHVTVDFAAGKIHGIVGHNGSGKTMLLKCASGYLKPTSGAVYLEDKELYRDISFPPSMGLILESPGFLPYATGYQNLMWLAAIRKQISKDDVRHALEIVGLDKVRGKLVGQYSLGMKQRLGIAQAIMEKPKLLILDEPFNALDADGVARIRRLIADLRDQGVTTLLTSHYQEDITVLCDRVYQIENGAITSAFSYETSYQKR